jgi:hypothetical protein
MRAMIVGLALVIAAAAGCGGRSDEEAVATVTAPPVTTQTPADPLERRLTRAGYHVVRNPTLAGARVSLTTGVKDMIVYIVDFESARAAATYAAQVARTARKAPKHVVARRAGNTVYSAVAAESPTATAVPGPVLELIRDAEGRRARPVRLSPQ